MKAALISSLLEQGCSPDFDEETNRKILVVNLFALVGIMLTSILGLRALLGQEYPLAGSLFIASIFFVLARQIQLVYNNTVGRLIAVNLLLGCLMGLMAYLVVSGGKNNTGPLWIYVVPPVAMFYAGVTRGLMTVGVFTLMISLLMFFPNDALLLTSYDQDFKIRLLLSFLTVTFLSAFYEYSRQKTFDTVQQLSEQFEQQALHDPLTRLPNRRGIQQQLTQELARLRRNGRPFSLILADIDHFKNINDNHGHSNGDEVLRRVSGIFQNRLRGLDMVARWGGEEFLIVAPETPESNAEALAEKIRTSLAETPIVLNGFPIKVTASFGVCEVSKDVELERALTLADKALYKSKQNGRNRVTCAAVTSE
ncbi:GGDEF domain-containing protein [Alteromonas aestuariivivens]|uniref:diguanylate cyclase n=1 Tax=Alteromonas aestuariivivens TaxID=1938339 RepID=A0A3D8M519_9ALTE|nr:GGDEF domain-containing protein [Alteromonas aestuariivivens]RDV24242.1 GGDEF domain-containing protein [Alteromonas aestuariivivens]